MCAPSGQRRPCGSDAVGEGVESGSDSGIAGDGFVRQADQRLALQRAPDHRIAPAARAGGIAAGTARSRRLPEAGDVLAQLAQHEIAAVAAEVRLVGRVLGARQQCVADRAAGRAAAGRCSRRTRSG